jgi:hypothetical protein
MKIHWPATVVWFFIVLCIYFPTVHFVHSIPIVFALGMIAYMVASLFEGVIEEVA